jgi:hypothetical protein
MKAEKAAVERMLHRMAKNKPCIAGSPVTCAHCHVSRDPARLFCGGWNSQWNSSVRHVALCEPCLARAVEEYQLEPLALMLLVRGPA